jgi:hypothetical protein
VSPAISAAPSDGTAPPPSSSGKSQESFIACYSPAPTPPGEE